MENLLNAALGYADRGRPVFPCTLDKKPLTATGFKNATADLATIRKWWTRHPGASIGSPTGGDTGIFVVDVDMPDGPVTLARLEQENGPLPATLEQRTGSGGRHLFFNHPGWIIRNSAKRLGPGLDTRGDGGYVILPPSPHPSGNLYEWTTRHPIAEAPAWLLEKLTERQTEKPAPMATGGEYGRAALARELADLTGTAEGSRNDRLNTAAFSLGQLVAGGELDRGQVEAALTAAAASIGLPYQEAAATIRSGLEGGSREPRTAPERKAGSLSPAPTKENAAQVKTERRLIEFCDLADELDNPRPHDWMIAGLIEAHTTGAIFGASTAGKSFLAVDLTLSVATGTAFLGASVVKAGPVVYFAGEGRHGIPRRARAWLADKGLNLPRGRVVLPRGRVELDRIGAKHVSEAIERMAEPPVLIVVDTVARSLPSGSDENSAKDMMEFINAVDALRDRFGCTVVLVHHTGHGQDSQSRARGSSAFRAAMDWELLVDKTKNETRFTKMKDAELPPPLNFEIATVDDSAVFRVTGEAARETGPRLTKSEELGLSTLRDALHKSGRDWSTLDEWRLCFYRRHTGDNQAAKRVAFHRSREGLVSKGRIFADSDSYRPSVTNVTKRNNVTPVTGLERNERNTTHKGVTSVTHPDQAEDVEEIPW